MKNTHLFLDVVHTLVLIHLSKCHDVTRVAKEQDLGTRSGCHSNVPEIKAVFSLTFLFIYLLFYSFRLFRWSRFAHFCGFDGFVSVVSFRCFGF